MHAFAGASVRVLSPCPAYLPSRGANDNSIVLKVTYGRRALLLTGDAEHAAEESLLTGSASALRADVLKVGHHGSRTSSSSALLAAVQPSFATISCGVRNRFGHPVPEVMARIARAGARVLRTDRDGALQLTSDGDSLQVLAAYPAPSTAFAYRLGRWLGVDATSGPVSGGAPP
ncbi:MAG: hypothetical protein QM756_22735 [Polyangiaceae bacterium]